MSLSPDLAELSTKGALLDADILAFRAVMKGVADNSVKLPTSGAVAIRGFTLEDGLSGEFRPIAEGTEGRVYATAGAAFAANVDLMSDTAGKLVTATGANYVCARSFEAATADGDIVVVKPITHDIVQTGEVGGTAIAAAAFKSLYAAGGSNGAGAVTLTGAAVGDKVVDAFNITDGTSSIAAFETVITVANQIQQSAATNLSAKAHKFLLIAA